MFDKITSLFQKKPSAEQQYLEQHKLKYDQENGYIIDDVVLNDLSEKIVYFSNRKVENFNDLEGLFQRGMLIKEKIDLEIHTQQYTQRLGNNNENLTQLKQYVIILNDYYRLFKRDKS
jgi:hypothetical protein